VTDRVPSDHGTVTSHRTDLDEIGRTGRPRVPLPDAVDASVGDGVRLSVGGERYHARIEESLGGDPDLRGAFANARLARTSGEGRNHFRKWVEAAGLATGDAVLLDVVTDGYAYGLREPGTRAVYTPLEPPSSSLSDIARDLDG